MRTFFRRQKILFGLLVAIAPAPGSSSALAANGATAALDPAERASAETMLAALGSDPFAEGPLESVVHIYERGPGLQALRMECRRRQTPAVATWFLVEGRVALLGHLGDGPRILAHAADLTKEPPRLRRLARILDDGGDAQAAIRAYRGGLNGASALETRDILMRLGALLLAQKDIRGARAAWDEVKKQAPTDQTTRRKIAETLGAKGYYVEAIAEFEELEPLLKQDPHSLVTVVRREAELARRAGNRKGEVAQRLIRAFEISAELDQSTLEAELALELLRDYERGGLDELLKIIRKEKIAHVAANGLEGEVLSKQGDRAAAAVAFRQLLNAKPGDAYALRRLCALEEGADRIRALTALFNTERNDPSVGLDLVGALIAAKRPAEAVTQAHVLVERFFSSPLVLSELGRQLSQAGEHQEALRITKRALELDPQKPEAVIAYGDELRATGRASEAADDYFLLIKTDDSSNSYRRLIEVLNERKLTESTKNAYLQALRKWPADETLVRDYARWLATAGLLEESLAQWKHLQQATQNAFLRDYAAREVKRIETEKLLGR